jgi:hypothetical protein
MANNCTIQIVNGTATELLATESHAHHMSSGKWVFGNIGETNYQTFAVEFWDGHGDDGDGAWQDFGISPGGNIVQLVAESDSKSNHYLKFKGLAAPNPNLVLVINPTGAILETLEANDLSWFSLPTSNQAVFGLGVVDLSILFTGPELQEYVDSINAGNLSYDQDSTLQETLKGLFESVLSTDAG